MNLAIFVYATSEILGIVLAESAIVVHSFDMTYVYLSILSPPLVFYVGKVRMRIARRAVCRLISLSDVERYYGSIQPNGLPPHKRM